MKQISVSIQYVHHGEILNFKGSHLEMCVYSCIPLFSLFFSQ